MVDDLEQKEGWVLAWLAHSKKPSQWKEIQMFSNQKGVQGFHLIQRLIMLADHLKGLASSEEAQEASASKSIATLRDQALPNWPN